MAKTRNYDNTVLKLSQVGGSWADGFVSITSHTTISDGVNPEHSFFEPVTYPIASLPAQVLADLRAAWQGIKAHHESESPALT